MREADSEMTLTEQLLGAADEVEQLAQQGNFHAIVLRRAILTDAIEEAPAFVQYLLDQLLKDTVSC